MFVDTVEGTNARRGQECGDRNLVLCATRFLCVAHSLPSVIFRVLEFHRENIVGLSIPTRPNYGNRVQICRTTTTGLVRRRTFYGRRRLIGFFVGIVSIRQPAVIDERVKYYYLKSRKPKSSRTVHRPFLYTHAHAYIFLRILRLKAFRADSHMARLKNNKSSEPATRPLHRTAGHRPPDPHNTVTLPPTVTGYSPVKRTSVYRIMMVLIRFETF